MQRTLPAIEQISQVDVRIRDLKENIISNIKDSQILRSNFTTMMHTSKESNEQLKSEILEKLSAIRQDLVASSANEEENVKEIEKELVSLNSEKRSVNDGILLLEKRIQGVEIEVGSFKMVPDELEND